MIAEAGSPEEAARLGRRHQRLHPSAMRPDWDQAKLQVMLAALRAKVGLFVLCSNSCCCWVVLLCDGGNGCLKLQLDFRALTAVCIHFLDASYQVLPGTKRDCLYGSWTLEPSYVLVTAAYYTLQARNAWCGTLNHTI